MIALLSVLTPLLGTFFPSLFSYMGRKQDTALAGAQHAMTTDVEVARAMLAAHTRVEEIKAASNTWLGARIIAGTAGELSAIYYGSIVLDSMFHFGWNIAKLPHPWDDYSWVILSSFIVVSPVAPVLSATAAWLTRR